MKTEEQFDEMTYNSQEKYLTNLSNRYTNYQSKAQTILDEIFLLDEIFGANFLEDEIYNRDYILQGEGKDYL